MVSRSTASSNNAEASSETEKLKDLQIVAPYELGVNTSSTHPLHIPRPLWKQLTATAALNSSETAAVLLVVFEELLRRYTAQSSVAVDFFRNGEFVTCVSLEGDLPFQTAASQAANAIRIVGTGSSGTRAHSAHPSAQARVSIWSACPPMRLEEIAHSAAIHLVLDFSGSQPAGYIEAEPKSWNPDTVASFAEHFQLFLRWVIGDREKPLSHFDIVTAEERQQIASWNQTGKAFPYRSAFEAFAAHAKSTPDAPALQYGQVTYTYAETAERTGQLAQWLRENGAGPDILVGVHLERSAEMVIALLAIFQAGAAYLPLDPNLPPERIGYMQDDANPRIIITTSRTCASLPPSKAKLLCVDELPASTGTPIQTWTPSAPEHLAYVLYTSGSTGKPKGVQITHGALATLLHSMSQLIPLGSEDVVLATTVISFDISVFEIFGPLTSGASVVVVTREAATSGQLLGEVVARTGATLLQATPSGWRLLVEAQWKGSSRLTLLTAGEPLEPRLAKRLLECGKDLWNLYGPTEATVYATAKQVRSADEKITVGRLLPHYKGYVLDAQQRLVPIGAIGELYIGGPAVARGYLNRPELTGERFVPDPFAGQPGVVMYRTGDLARLLPDGEIDVLGRTDNQVKIRGYRIELGEIETHFETHPRIRKCVAKVEDREEGDKRLVAYVQSDEPLPHSELRSFGSGALPGYMVPSAFFTVDSFPLTSSGKVDRKALDSSQFSCPANPQQQTSADQLEREVLEAWRLILQMPNLGLDDSFFEVGGHSLLATRIFVSLEQKTGKRLPPSTLIEAPTVRKLVARLRHVTNTNCLVPLQPVGSRSPLYIVHHVYGDVLAYRPLAEQFAPDRPVVGIQAPTEVLDDRSLQSVEELAALYVRQILQQQPQGPFCLAGYSSGSVFAFEMAHQLSRLGHEVGLLALIDGMANVPMPPPSRWVRVQKSVCGKACRIVFKFKDEWGEGPKHFVMKRLQHLWLRWRLRVLARKGLGQPRTGMSMQEVLVMIENAYQPKPYPGPALLIRFRDDAPDFDLEPLSGWDKVIQGGLTVVLLPGSHATAMMSHRVSALVSTLDQQLARATSWPSSVR